MNSVLEGYAAAVFQAELAKGPGGQFAQLTSDLGAINEAFSTNLLLRSALTDTAVPGSTRRMVLSTLLESKVCDCARRVAAFAAGTVPAPQVPVAIDWLFIRALHLSEGVLEVDHVPGHMQARDRAGGFATAIFEDLGLEDLEEIEDELFRFARIVESTPALRTALANRDLGAQARKGVVDQLLEGKVTPTTLELVRYVVEEGRPRDLIGTLDYLVEQTAKARGWRVARLRAAAEIDSDQRTRLAASLSALSGANVEIQVTIDESLLAGAVIEVGDMFIDATARGRLDRLRDHLLPGGWDVDRFKVDGAEPEGAK